VYLERSVALHAQRPFKLALERAKGRLMDATLLNRRFLWRFLYFRPVVKWLLLLSEILPPLIKVNLCQRFLLFDNIARNQRFIDG
jgi:hypothetical protein